MSDLRNIGYLLLYGVLGRALPLVENDAPLWSQGQGLLGLVEDRLNIPRSRPSRAERRLTSEEERYRHE